ncbi:MAG: hypothetical protein WC253_03215 [Sulfurovaceae bacterium]|nr:hypothetical protein [Sulfurovaceae bacterium]
MNKIIFFTAICVSSILFAESKCSSYGLNDFERHLRSGEMYEKSDNEPNENIEQSTMKINVKARYSSGGNGYLSEDDRYGAIIDKFEPIPR